MASQTSFSSSPPHPRVIKSAAAQNRHHALYYSGVGACCQAERLLRSPPFRGPAINLHAKESPVAKTWGKQSGGLYGIGAAQGHLFVLYYQQGERHSGEAIAIARTANRERRLKTRT